MEREIGLNSEYSKCIWGLVASEQNGGGGVSVGGKVLRGGIQVRCILAESRPG